MITGIPCKKNHRLAQKCHLIIIIAVVILISQIPTFISWLLWHEKADIFYLIFSVSDWIPSQDIFYFFSLFFHSNKHDENHIAVCSFLLHWLFNHEYSGFLNIVEPQFLWILLMSWSTIKSICHWSQDHLWWVTHLGPFLRLEFTDLLSYPHSCISIKGQLRHKRSTKSAKFIPANILETTELKTIL